MRRWILTAVSVLGLNVGALAMAQDQGFNFGDINTECTSGTGYVGYSASENTCNTNIAQNCLDAAGTACASHGGLSSYSCSPCAFYASPGPTGGIGEGYYGYLEYYCND